MINKSLTIKRIVVLLFICFLLIGHAYPQVYSALPATSVISTKVVRLKYKGQTDSLRIPVVSAFYPELKEALSETKIFDGQTLAKLKLDYQKCGCNITGLDYEVTFVNKDVISVILRYETMGAYPDNYETWLTLDMHTGKPYPITKEITPAGMAWALNNYKILMKKELLRIRRSKVKKKTRKRLMS
jgi:hypothetical protein